MKAHRSWAWFDDAVTELAEIVRPAGVEAVYGEPRGGLVLAVAMSHALGVPLLTEQPRAMAARKVLWCDDIVDSGATLVKARVMWGYNAFIAVALVARSASAGEVIAYETTPTDDWYVFPWERDANAAADEAEYRAQMKSLKAALP